MSCGPIFKALESMTHRPQMGLSISGIKFYGWNGTSDSSNLCFCGENKFGHWRTMHLHSTIVFFELHFPKKWQTNWLELSNLCYCGFYEPLILSVMVAHKIQK